MSTRIRRRHLLRAGAACTLAGVLALPSRAQVSFAQHPLTMVVPFPPGGGTDGLGRLLAKALGERLGQTVVVENYGGAGGTIGTAAAARAKPDGYTLMLGTVATHSIAPELYPKLSYDAVKDFTPLANFAYLTNYIVVGPSLQVRSVSELLALAKSKPGQVSFASAGSGTPAHLAIELLQQRTGVKLLHVPFKGGGPAILGVVSGQVDAIIGDPLSVNPQIRAGKLRALAIAGPERSRDFPEVPTTREVGLADFEVRAWHGALAPAGTPQPLVDAMTAAISAALKDPAVLASMERLGAEPAGEKGEAFARLIAGERAKWGQVIRAGKVEIS